MLNYTPVVLEFNGMLFCPSQCVNETCGRQTIAKIDSYQKTYRISDESPEIRKICNLYKD
jgi:hypothetical protein